MLRVRIYKNTTNNITIETFINNIDIGTQGKEIILQVIAAKKLLVSKNFDNTFYTDSNGHNKLKRVENARN